MIAFNSRTNALRLPAGIGAVVDSLGKSARCANVIDVVSQKSSVVYAISICEPPQFVINSWIEFGRTRNGKNAASIYHIITTQRVNDDNNWSEFTLWHTSPLPAANVPIWLCRRTQWLCISRAHCADAVRRVRHGNEHWTEYKRICLRSQSIDEH